MALATSAGWSEWFECSEHYRDVLGWTSFLTADREVVREYPTERIYQIRLEYGPTPPEEKPRSSAQRPS